jgi:hypothetical protein
MSNVEGLLSMAGMLIGSGILKALTRDSYQLGRGKDALHI